MQDDDEVIQVPVPKRFLSVVYRALAEAMQENGQSPRENANVAEDDDAWEPGENGYTEGKVRRLRKHMTNSSVIAALDVLAERAPDKVTYSELVEATERPHLGLRADLAGLTRLCKRLFGQNAGWPLEVYYTEEEATYYMSEKVATWWRSAM